MNICCTSSRALYDISFYNKTDSMDNLDETQSLSDFASLLNVDEKNIANAQKEYEYNFFDFSVYDKYPRNDIHKNINSLEDFIDNYNSVKIPSFENFYRENYGSSEPVSYEEEFSKYLKMRGCSDVDQLQSLNKSGCFRVEDVVETAQHFVSSCIGRANGKGVATEGEPVWNLVYDSLSFDDMCEIAKTCTDENEGFLYPNGSQAEFKLFKKYLTNALEGLSDSFKDFKLEIEGILNTTDMLIDGLYDLVEKQMIENAERMALEEKDALLKDDEKTDSIENLEQIDYSKFDEKYGKKYETTLLLNYEE